MMKAQQSDRIVWHVRTLALVGLAMVLTTTGFVGWTLAGVRRERTHATAEQERLDDTLHQLRETVVASQREIRAGLDEKSDWQPRSQSASTQFTELVWNQLSAPGNAALTPLIDQLDDEAARFVAIATRVNVWRTEYMAVWDDLREQRTMNRVRDLIGEMSSAMKTVEGQRRLEAAIEYKRWQRASGPEASQLGQSILLDEGRRESEGMTDFDSQLAELARLVELLGGEEQFDSLDDLKDNKLKPVLDRLAGAIKELAMQGISPDSLSEKSLDNLKAALFGAGYLSDDFRQNVIPGKGGLFTLRRDALQLRRERDHLKGELTPLLQDVQTTTALLAESTQARTTALTRQMEQSLASGWNHMLLFGAGCSVLFLWLARRVARGIVEQVHTIEQSRAEAEASRQTTQQLMVEQQQAAAELVTAHQNLKISEERFRMLTDSAPIGIFETDADGQCSYTNEWWQRICARPAGESLGMGWYMLIHDEDKARVAAKLQQAVADACVYDCEYRITRPGGEIRWVHALAIAERSDEGKIIGSVGTLADITERKRAETELLKLHEELVETSRQAGMAEVATAVLHNVGNVLNSVNIASHCVAESVRRSRASSLARVVAMLREHEGKLDVFFNEDARGKQVTGFLSQLADHLASEQATALTELANLQKNIEHIKEIVAMQQGFARVCGVTETLQISELVEDSLRLNAASLANHDVKVECDFGEVPSITVEKHKVLQILVNLVRNAKHACEASDRKDKLVKLRVSNGDGRVRICVADNGVGIPTENLNRIFNHGFTTKKNGHGFGLHSGALAAREMGGALIVESEGAGYGASFTLELPLQP